MSPAGSSAREAEPPPRRRGRPPSEELVARRRQELIEAAYEVFSEKGYTAAGIADIAQKLDIGHGTFYRYFESKRDILDHVVDYGVERVLSVIEADAPPQAAESLEEFLDQMRRISQRLFELVDSEPGLVQVVLLEATSIDEELTRRLMGLMDTFGVMAASYVEHGVQRGFLRSDLDTEVVAHGISALVMPGLLLALRGDFGPEQRRRYRDGLIGLIADGIRRR
jgi:AcrR family transcriptional regulator